MNKFDFVLSRPIRFETFRTGIPLLTKFRISSVSRSLGKYFISAFIDFTGDGL